MKTLTDDDDDKSDEQLIDEIDIDPKQSGKNIENIIRKTINAKEPNKRLIIRFVVRSKGGTSIEEMDFDPETPDKNLDEIIRQKLQDLPSSLKDPKNDKILYRILKRPQREQQEPTEDESIGEFQIDPKQPEKFTDKIINDVIRPEKSKKDSRQKIVLRFVIIKPDGSQSIEDLIVDPAQYADDKDLDKIIREILRKAPKKLENPKDQLIFRVLRRKPQSTTIQPMKSEEAIQRKPSTKSQTIPESKPDEEEEIVEEEADDDDEPVGEFDIDPKFPLKNLNEIRRKTFDSKEPNKLIILRFIIRQPDGSESIEEMEIDPETSDEEIEQIINELLNESPSKIEDPKKEKIIFKILRRKSPKDQEPMEDEMIDEFTIDPKQPEKLADKIMEKTIKPVTKKPGTKDPRERIVIRFVIRRPDGSESIEELVIDPDMNDQDIERIIRDILRQTPKKLRDQRDKPIIRVLKRRPQQPKQAEKPKYPGDEQTTKSPKKTSEQSTKSPSKSTTIDSDEESIGNFIIDPLKPENYIDQIVQSIKSQARDPRKKLILRIVHQIPERSTDQIEEYLIDSECPEFDIANILGELPEKVTDTREKTLINFIVKSRDDDRLPAGDIRPSAPPLTSDSDDNIIIRIVVQRPNQQRTIEEFQLPRGSIASRNDIENLIKQINQSTTEKIKEPNTTIITRVIKQTPDGQESIKEYQIDQQTATDDIDKIIRSNIRPKQRRIITRVVIRKPDGSEHVEEIEIDPEVDDIDEIIRQKIGETATKITGPARVSTRLIRQKPDGNEEEMELYPDDQSDDEGDEDEDGDYDDELLEEFKIDPKSPDRNLNDIVNRMIQSKIQPSNDDSTKKLVIRYVIIRTDDNDNGEEIEEMIVDPQTTEEEIRDIIREILMETPKKLKNSNDRVVFRIIYRQSKYFDDEDQTAADDKIIGEFEIDPKFPETNVDEIIHRTTTTTTEQPTKEKIFIRLIIIRPGFGEQIEELEIDPKLDSERIGRIIRDMLLDVPNKLHEPQDRIIFVILRRPQRKRQRKQQQRKQQQQSEQQHDIDDIISRAIRSSVPLSSQQRKSCRLTTSSTSEEIINEIEIIPQTSEQTINDFVHRTIRSSGSSGQTSDMNIRIIIKILSRKSSSLIGGNDNDDLIEQFEMNPSTTSDKDIDTIVRKILRTIQSRRRESNERIILRIVKRKKTNSQDSLDDDDEPESATGDDIDEIIRKSLRTSTTTNRDPNNKIITRVVHVQPSGDEKSIEEIELDPNSMEQDLDDILRKTIKTNRNKYPGGKIITRIIWRKSNGKESIVDEMPIDSKITEMDLDDMIRKAIRQTILRIKDLVNSKMITRIVRLKPGGSESIEELELDPDLQDDQQQTDDNNRRQQQSSYTKIITRIIRQKSNDDDDDDDDDDSKEILEEFQTIPESPDSDIDDAIRESILSARTLSSSMLKDSNIQIITRVIRLKPNGEKSIEEFEMIDDPNETDSDNDNEDFLNDNGIRKIIRTRSLTIKDSTGKIITRVVRKKSNEQQQREEQQQSDDTIGQFVRKTIRDKISPVKDKAGDFITRTFKPQTQQKISSTTTTTQTAGIKHQQQRPQTKTSESSSSFGFMRKTYSSAVKELPRDLKGKSPPFRAGGLPARDIHGNIIPSTMTTTTTTTRISKPTAYSAAVTAEARRPEPRKTTSQSIQDRVGNKFGKFVTPSSSSASSSSLSSRDSRSKSKTPPTTADNRPRMTFSLRTTPERESQTTTKIGRQSVQIKKSTDSKGFIKVGGQQRDSTKSSETGDGTRIPVFSSPGGGGGMVKSILKESQLSPKSIEQEIDNDSIDSNVQSNLMLRSTTSPNPMKTKRRNNRTTTTTTTKQK
ncbi:uncharacterized protein LOC142644809 [Dermatophagoides pteronyssinus]|uniref:uncharacterized protein LOC142644809 n=1 Tax=Dermatophagoides pteronyssinus TaxID=6956 RepID=UPI003F667F84